MSAAPDTPLEARNRAVVEAAFAKWGTGAGGPFDLLADEASWTIVGHSVASKTYPTKAAFMSEVIVPFNARMSQGIRPTVRQLIVKNDTVVIFFDARGVAKDGKPYVNTYAWFWEMREGRAIRAYAFFDSIEFNDLWARVAP